MQNQHTATVSVGLYQNIKSFMIKPAHFLFLCSAVPTLHVWSAGQQLTVTVPVIPLRPVILLQAYDVWLLRRTLLILLSQWCDISQYLMTPQLWFLCGFARLYFIFKGPPKSVYTSHGSLGYCIQTLYQLQQIWFVLLSWHCAIFLDAFFFQHLTPLLIHWVVQNDTICALQHGRRSD